VSDATAAERARRYRARRRERDGSVTSREPELLAIMVEIRAEIGALRAGHAELAGRSYPQPADSVDNRDGGARHAVRRDVTERHAEEGAPARAHASTRLTGPTGPSEPATNQRDVTAETGLVVAKLAAVHEPASIGALADAIELPDRVVAAVLVGLVNAGRAQRIPASAPGDRDRWQLVADPVGETIRCAAYREHQLSGHRRDPLTGRFRCYQCEPEQLAAEAI